MRLLSKGEKSHHSSLCSIQMRFPSGEIATTDEDNEKVFPIHFGKVLNDMKPTDDSVINRIQLRDTPTELDTPPEWAEFNTAVTELTSDKAPGLNNVPPNAFKSMMQ